MTTAGSVASAVPASWRRVRSDQPNDSRRDPVKDGVQSHVGHRCLQVAVPYQGDGEGRQEDAEPVMASAPSGPPPAYPTKVREVAGAVPE